MWHPQLRSLSWVAALGTALSLLAIWGARFLPMQDHPQHLFLAYVLTTFDDPNFDWARHYAIDFKPGPYALFYLVLRALIPLLGPEEAAKVWTSAAVLLLAGFLWSEAVRRVRAGGAVPWTLVLMLPLGFHQVYFLGFQNYLLSIPLCLWALRAHEDLARTPGPRPVAVLVAWLLPLVFIHPYTVLVFITLSGAAALRQGKCGGRAGLWAAPLCLLVLFCAWYIAQGSLRPDFARATPSLLRWMSPGSWAQYGLLPFVGMSIQRGTLSLLHIGAWAAIALSILWAWREHRHPGWIPVQCLQLALCALGVLVLPFWLGYFSYFNARLWPLVYLLGARALAPLPLRPWQVVVVCSASLALVAIEIPRHRQISAEFEQLLPILAHMRPGARVLPAYGISTTQALDPVHFPQHHAHAHFYYHVLRGGGASPSLFPSTMIPVRLRLEANLPAVRYPLATIADHYDYVLVRGHSPDRVATDLRVPPIAVNGPWSLFAPAHGVAR